VFFRQFVDEDLGCASYLVGDTDTGVAVIVDPTFQIDEIVAAAAEAGLRIERVLETHTHADHVSGTAASRSSTVLRQPFTHSRRRSSRTNPSPTAT
jgi:glyoxylase-like metal-dependent hydrolase (beta-lactamase superfamily II)